MSIWDSTALIVTFYCVVLLSVVGMVCITALAPFAPQIFTVPTALQNYTYVISWVYKLDSLFVFLVFGGLLAILYRAHAINASFADFAVGFLASVLILFISFYLANIFTATLQTPAFASGVGAFAGSIYILKEWPVFQGFESLLYLLVILVKVREGSVQTPTRDGLYG